MQRPLTMERNCMQDQFRKQKHYRQAPAGKSGFSLIELSVALAVVGLLLSAFLYQYRQSEITRLQHKKDSVIFSIADGLSKYLSRNGHYPCPASIINVNSSSSSYGGATVCTDTSVPIGTCDNARGYCVTSGSGGQRIRIGALPFKDMRIGKEDILDAYGNQFTYAVTEMQASPGLYTTGGGMILLRNTDQNGVLTTQTADMVLIGHGPNGRGAYNSEGRRTGYACAGPGRDIENCNNDGTFVKYPYAKVQGANEFDDQILTDTDLWSWIYIWDQTTSDSNSIYNRDVGNIGIDTATPAEKLDVANGNMRIEGSNTQTSRLCKGDGTACFEPRVLGGTPPAGGMTCPAGAIMAGIANGAPICVSAFGIRNGGCTGSSAFVSGFNYYASSQNLTVNCTDVFSGSMSVVPVN